MSIWSEAGTWVGSIGSVAAAVAAWWAARQSSASSRENERIASELSKTIEAVAKATCKNAEETKELVKQTAHLAEVSSQSTRAASQLAEATQAHAIESVRPHIVAYPTKGSAYAPAGEIHLTIRNLGTTPAYNLCVQITSEAAERCGFLDKETWEVFSPERGGKHLPPQHEFSQRVLIGEPIEIGIAEHYAKEPFVVDVLITYQGQLGPNETSYLLPLKFVSNDLFRFHKIPTNNQ